jgi:hypothetical protein
MQVAVVAAVTALVSALALVDLVAAVQAHSQAQEMPEQQTLAAAAAVHQMLLLMRVVLADRALLFCPCPQLSTAAPQLAHLPSPHRAAIPSSSLPHLGVIQRESLRQSP